MFLLVDQTNSSLKVIAKRSALFAIKFESLVWIGKLLASFW